MRYVGGIPDSIKHFFDNKPNVRPDLDGDVPFYGVDEDGVYADPPDYDSLIEWARNHSKRFSDPKFMWPAYRGALLMKKLLQYCMECGMTRKDLQEMMGTIRKLIDMCSWAAMCRKD